MVKNLTFLLLLFPFIATAQFNLNLESYATGFNKPVAIVSAGDERLFIVQQNGTIRILDGNGDLLPTPFISISVNFGANEQGMLGMVFHPDYANNGYFYVNHTAGSGDGFNRIARYSVDPNDPNKADPNSLFEILTVTQPEWNHNGGNLAFGPDGYLYIGFGDGGSGGDPWGNGQNTQTMLGKMLRIDVDGGSPYAIPSSNPYINDPDILDEIWAVGMRNPWRYSFDRHTGDLWIGDVGQNAKEEIDFIAAADVVAGGFNFGWDCREGDVAYQPNNCLAGVAFTEPVAFYKVSNFCNSVTGGFVYRSCEYPDMYGRYFYADYCNGLIWSLTPDGNGGWINEEVYENASFDISSFGEDHEGNLYVARHGNGAIYKLTSDYEWADIFYDEPNDQIVAAGGFEGYQWYKDNTLLPGQTNQILTGFQALGNGNYYCQLTYGLGNCTENTNEAEVTGIVSALSDIPGLTLIDINPNPFKDKLLLNISAKTLMDMTIHVLDVNGEVLLSVERKNSSTFQETLDLSHLSSGVYFVQLQTEVGKVTRKVVKR
jgi:glucose/arabinose dehydrogenase